MRYRYDLHIHTALSPCADDGMTPVTVVGRAKLAGLDMVAVSDHNAIGHVPLAMRAGEEYGITVVPAVEIQSAEDIHLLCLFGDYGGLEKFFGKLAFPNIKNRAELFGNQLLYDEDDNVVGCERRLLLAGAFQSCDEVRALAETSGGIAVPAHIDRDGNSMLKILGCIPGEYSAVELSPYASAEQREYWLARKAVISDSDAHTPFAEFSAAETELEELSAAALVDALRRGVFPKGKMSNTLDFGSKNR